MNIINNIENICFTKNSSYYVVDIDKTYKLKEEDLKKYINMENNKYIIGVSKFSGKRQISSFIDIEIKVDGIKKTIQYCKIIIKDVIDDKINVYFEKGINKEYTDFITELLFNKIKLLPFLKIVKSDYKEFSDLKEYYYKQLEIYKKNVLELEKYKSLYENFLEENLIKLLKDNGMEDYSKYDLVCKKQKHYKVSFEWLSFDIQDLKIKDMFIITSLKDKEYLYNFKRFIEVFYHFLEDNTIEMYINNLDLLEGLRK